MTIEVVIYLCDNSSKKFLLENGRSLTTVQFFELMLNALDLKDKQLATKCFSLWLKSPLLDVQLKPQHVPFRILQEWPHFVHKYSMASEMEKSADEPILIFRRNAFLTRKEEMNITDHSVLHLLQIEAKFNIQQGVYPCDDEDLQQLGELVCHNARNTEAKVRENLANLLPTEAKMKKRTSLFKRQPSVEEKIVKNLTQVQQKTSSIVENPLLEFMKICWQLPYYGSVIFHGIVEKQKSGNITSIFHAANSVQIEVYVGINTEGVYVIDAGEKHVLVGLKYNEFNWEITKPEDQAKNQANIESGKFPQHESMPSLFLEFHDGNASTVHENDSSLLQIISKEAPMMNSMIETCMSIFNQNGRQDQQATSQDEQEATTSNHGPDHHKKSTLVRPLFLRQTSVTTNRTDKLSLVALPSDDMNTSNRDSSTVKKKSLFRRMTSVGAKNSNSSLEDNTSPLVD